MAKLTTQQFIIKANNKHNNRYDYSKTIYTGSKEYLTITCPEHGDFSQQARNHLYGYGCNECGKGRQRVSVLLTEEDFLIRANKVHSNKYKYLSPYVNLEAKMKMLCHEHGEFYQDGHSHLKGSGCPKCALAKKGYSRTDYIEQAKSHNNKSKLYILKCYNEEEEFYKIGITMKTVKARYYGKKAMPYEYETTLLLEGDAGQIWDLEKKLHRQFKDLSYTPKLSFGGQTECFKGLSEEIITTFNSSNNEAKINQTIQGKNNVHSV